MADLIICEGIVTLDNQGDPECSTGWVAIEYVPPFNPATDLDPVEIAGFVGAGFFVLLPLWVAVYGGRALLNLFKWR